ncbi:hypothetical protein KKB44_03115 [Candidatus Micrarchaeota archaeon]|nr:hypothetical protein [Candidatus Micrarchaeota archaeon]
MDDEEVEDIKKKKFEAKKAEEQLKATLRYALDESAYERLINVSLANKELYLTAAKNALMLFKRMGRKISESELLSLLTVIKEQTERESTIKFQRK